MLEPQDAAEMQERETDLSGKGPVVICRMTVPFNMKVTLRHFSFKRKKPTEDTWTVS